MVMADVRYSFVGRVAHDCITRKGEATQTLTDKIDKVMAASLAWGTDFLGRHVFDVYFLN